MITAALITESDGAATFEVLLDGHALGTATAARRGKVWSLNHRDWTAWADKALLDSREAVIDRMLDAGWDMTREELRLAVFDMIITAIRSTSP